MSVHVKGHPIHAMLVVFPVGLYVFALIFDLLYAGTGNVGWYTASFYNLAFGVVMTFFELLVQFLQAFIFTLLSALYISDAVSEQH